jgi:hypothetical protein
MNTRQKKILGSWRQLLWDFAKREWLSLFVSSSLGVLAAGSVHLFWLDHSFQSFLASLAQRTRQIEPMQTDVWVQKWVRVKREEQLPLIRKRRQTNEMDFRL